MLSQMRLLTYALSVVPLCSSFSVFMSELCWFTLVLSGLWSGLWSGCRLGLFKKCIFEFWDPGRWEDCLTYNINRFC